MDWPKVPQPPQQPQTLWEAASEQWARAMARLSNARCNLSNAQSELDESQRQEREAWEALEQAAERGPNVPTMAVGGPITQVRR